MRLTFRGASIAGLFALSACSANAQFAADEFNGPGLGAQWTWHDSTPTGSTHAVAAGHLQMTAQEGSDFWMTVNDHCYVEQDAPAGTNWEVVTKIDNFDPRAVGFKRAFQRTGIQLWQDNDHWVSIGMLSNIDGTDLGVQAFWQTDPVANRFDTDFHGTSEFFPMPLSPAYLKIQKTDMGYAALMSSDGVTWTNVLALTRNPETADGYFTAEKIRLYQSGGQLSGPNATGVCQQADFDYLRFQSLTAPPSGCKNDEFAGGALDSSVWKYYEGVSSGTLAVGGGKLTLTSGFGQDFWRFIDKAMHVYQDAPTSNSFEAVVKVGPTDLRTFGVYDSYGLMLWQDQCNWIMIGNQRSDANPVTNRLEIAYKRNGLFDVHYVDRGAGALPEYLNIAQDGSNYSARYSNDNVTWTSVPANGYDFPAKLKNAQVRLFTKKVPSIQPTIAAEFDWFHALAGPTAAADWQMFE